MTFEDRKELILFELKKKGKLSFQEIEKIVDVAPTTIRRDLSILAKEGELVRYHGGVRLEKVPTDLPMRQKENMNPEEKKIIAKRAAELILPEDFIFISSGSTTYAMLQYINDTSITVITNGIPHAEYLNNKNITTFLLCGFVKQKTRSLSGTETVEMIKKYSFDKSFIGASGVSDKLELLSADIFEHEIKEASVGVSKETYFLVDESKFGSTGMYKLSLKQLKKSFLITDAKIFNDSSIINVDI